MLGVDFGMLGLVGVCATALYLTFKSDARRYRVRRPPFAALLLGLLLLAGGTSAQATNALTIRMDDAFTKSLAKLSSRVESLENRVDKLERNVPAIAAARSTSTTQTSGQCTVCDLYNASLPPPAATATTATRFAGGYVAQAAWTEDPGIVWSSGGGKVKTKLRSKCSGGNCR